jgi:nucleoside 2-deoxyribosyltransferase
VSEIAIREACQTTGIVCERIDEQAFTGDFLSRIRSRLRNGNGVLALLDGANPNVFLEIGFACGAGKPTVLIARKDASVPFDRQGQKCIRYTSIANLRTLLTTELGALKAQGTFDATRPPALPPG